MPFEEACSEEERVLTEWQERKTVLQTEIDFINRELSITNAYRSNSDGCENTIFKTERYTSYNAENRRIQAKLSDANYRMARIDKYIAILNGNLGQDCVNKNSLLAE